MPQPSRLRPTSAAESELLYVFRHQAALHAASGHPLFGSLCPSLPRLGRL